MHIFVWSVPLVSLIFLKSSTVFLYLFALTNFLSLLAVLWNSAFKWVYFSFSPLLFTSLLFTAIYKASSDSHFAFLHFFFLGMVLIPASCTMSRTSIHSSSGTLPIRSNPLKSTCHFHCIIIRDLIQSYLSGLMVFPTFFNLSLNLAIRSSWSKPQSAPGLVFADCIELLHLWLQRI